MMALGSDKEADDFVKNGITITLTGETEIKGVKIFNANKMLMFEQEFKDGPYYFPEKGGTLKIEWHQQ